MERVKLDIDLAKPKAELLDRVVQCSINQHNMSDVKQNNLLPQTKALINNVLLTSKPFLTIHIMYN